MKAFIALFCGVLLAGPALAQDDNSHVNMDQGRGRVQNDSARTGDVNERGERLVCRMVSTSSTSRMAAHRVCHTADEWREIARASGD